MKNKIINFGSINIDFVYRVREFVRPGETIACHELNKFPGGKGLNQSLAIARAGGNVIHCGAIGPDGDFLLDLLRRDGVNCDNIIHLEDTATGHAIIQVADSGENSIIICGGANQAITADKAISLLRGLAEPGDFLLLQNEISSLEAIMNEAAKIGMRIFFNPAPMTPAVKELPLNLVDTLIVNETEAESLSNLPLSGVNILKTLGAKGACYNDSISVPAARVEKIVDTTAAGDTFIGYFLASLQNGQSVETAMETASWAAAVCISRPGAAPSIPYLKER